MVSTGVSGDQLPSYMITYTHVAGDTVNGRPVYRNGKGITETEFRRYNTIISVLKNNLKMQSIHWSNDLAINLKTLIICNLFWFNSGVKWLASTGTQWVVSSTQVRLNF